VNGVQILPLKGIPEVRPGDDLAAMLGDVLERAGGLVEGDVVVVAQKVVSRLDLRYPGEREDLQPAQRRPVIRMPACAL